MADLYDDDLAAPLVATAVIVNAEPAAFAAPPLAQHVAAAPPGVVVGAAADVIVKRYSGLLLSVLGLVVLLWLFVGATLIIDSNSALGGLPSVPFIIEYTSFFFGFIVFIVLAMLRTSTLTFDRARGTFEYTSQRMVLALFKRHAVSGATRELGQVAFFGNMGEVAMCKFSGGKVVLQDGVGEADADRVVAVWRVYMASLRQQTPPTLAAL
jgi:hypothetical protein